MFNPAAFSLKNSRTVLVLFAMVLYAGFSTFRTIGRLEYPEFTIRNAMVITAYPGRNAIQVEEEVTEPLEQSIRQMAEVKTVNSTSKSGVSIVSVELEDTYFDLDPIWQDLRNRVNETVLPDGARTPSVDDDIGDVYPYVYALHGDGFTDRELLDAAENIQDAVLAIDGVAKVEFHGDQEERIYLEFSSSKLAAYGFSPSPIGAALSGQNAISSSGNVRIGPERIGLVTLGEFESLDEIANYRLSSPGDASSIRVSDVMDIRRSYTDPPGPLSHYNGARVLCIAISMKKGGVVTEIGDRINQRLAELEAEMPWGLEIETMFYQPQYVAKSIQDFIVNLGQAFGFVLLIMFVFAGWRIALIVGVLVPSAVFTCFMFMPSMGVQLEMMSIAALIIALGLLVDNAVVVSEQILVRLSSGVSREDAVTKAVKNLTIPLLAASATTIAAFSPIAIAPGGSSEFTYSLFAVVSLTLLSSWVLSLTIIPLFCYYFLKPLKRDTLVGRGLEKCYDPYEKALRWVLRMGWLYPALILVLTVGAGWAFKFIPNIFFPPNERGQFIVDFEMPLGTDILQTEKDVHRLETWMLTELGDDVLSISSWIGSGGPRWYLSLTPEPSNPNYALLSVLTQTEDPAEVGRLVAAVNTYAADALPVARVTAKMLENGPPVGDPIQIRLYGSDMGTLYALRDTLVEEIGEVDGMHDLRDDWGAWTKQLSIKPDAVRMARLGFTTSQIADALNLQFSGTKISNFREGEKSIPVVMRSTAGFREHSERLQDLPVFGSPSGVVPLGLVADVEMAFLPGSILRENTLRVMTIKGRVRDRFASEALADIRPRLAALMQSKDWPAGYHVEYGGEQEESGEAKAGIAAAMPIAFSALAFILISQFNSLRRFVIIALTIPPMLIGVTPGLILTGSSFGFMTMLGLIALLGIIVNNAILLIDEIDVQWAGQKDIVDAIVAACRSRLRPIIMTTVTTVIGLLPLALGGGGMWSSMAYAMMFGLGFATVLTLFLCPVLFFRFFRKKK
jgi:multidrug efflux pump subunit AcrB